VADIIESNMFSIVLDAQSTVGELLIASEYQCKAGRYAACLTISRCSCACACTLSKRSLLQFVD
ncbi:uncharacterized protein BJ212DRAFT_1289707, partial [Suillus subaureus]